MQLTTTAGIKTTDATTDYPTTTYNRSKEFRI